VQGQVETIQADFFPPEGHNECHYKCRKVKQQMHESQVAVYYFYPHPVSLAPFPADPAQLEKPESVLHAVPDCFIFHSEMQKRKGPGHDKNCTKWLAQQGNCDKTQQRTCVKEHFQDKQTVSGQGAAK